MPKQVFSLLDYCGVLLVGACFAAILFVLSFLMNFIFIQERDDITSFEKVRLRQLTEQQPSGSVVPKKRGHV